MQLKLKIVHMPGVYSLMDVEGMVYSPKHPIQNVFYDRDDPAEKQRAEMELYVFARGVVEGWNLARNGLGTVFFDGRTEELKLEKADAKT